jgi:hypothetical protein
MVGPDRSVTYSCFFMLLISVHMINILKENKLTHIIFYLFNLSLVHLRDMFRQRLCHYQEGLHQFT